MFPSLQGIVRNLRGNRGTSTPYPSLGHPPQPHIGSRIDFIGLLIEGSLLPTDQVSGLVYWHAAISQGPFGYRVWLVSGTKQFS